MNYEELSIELANPDEQADIVTALLQDIGFESFQQENNLWKGYLPQDLKRDWSQILDERLPTGFVKNWRSKTIEKENWNQNWESSYPKTELDKGWTIIAPFHAEKNDKSIIIQPQMSFGTGQHPTTRLMSNYLINNPPVNYSVLDMGSGTGVLAILASRLKAREITAIDNEAWAYRNIQENLSYNLTQDIQVVKSDQLTKTRKKLDLILANINKNTLIHQSKSYNFALKEHGLLVISGFFKSDLQEIGTHFESDEFDIMSTHEENGWAMMVLKKLKNEKN